jgi:hypothetical protein
MEGALKGLFGGGGDDDGDGRRDRARDFVQRYTTGDPTEGYSREEAESNFREVARNASPDQLQRAYQRTIENLPDDQRAQFNQMLQDRQAGRGMVEIERTGGSAGGGGGDPFGGLLGGLLGGGAAGGLGDVLGGFMGGGDDDRDRRQSPGGGDGGMFGGLGDLLGSPVGKAVLGGIAAFAMKEVLEKR